MAVGVTGVGVGVRVGVGVGVGVGIGKLGNVRKRLRLTIDGIKSNS